MNDSPLKSRTDTFVIPTYSRFPLAFTHGEGCHVFATDGTRYLDLGAGIATACLGHGHPELAAALAEQAGKLTHVSNLYHTEPQGLLAEKLVALAGGSGKIFFCNSGAEANEALYKLTRLRGHDEGQFEILTTLGSFHGRTLAGIAATGQQKVKEGFAPAVEGFRHVPYDDVDAIREAITPATGAILVEPIQGESGIHCATPEYLLDLRALCDERNLLLLLDEVQCGHFRTGNFFAWQTIMATHPDFAPDACSMAKSLAAGLPMGAIWASEPLQDILGPGTHGTTFGGTPLVSAHALKALEIIERDSLAQNAVDLGNHLADRIQQLIDAHPNVLKEVRGLGLMIGVELAEGIPAFAESKWPASVQIVERLHDAGLLTIPAGARVFRLLPPLNLSQADADEGLAIIESVIKDLAS
ncbi:MAG: aspartate aminotransferase family protein [Verrucomicrobiales bacterium]|nr:aspartate aminotransferase family protein [Verrucomicrobiales bacterium]|tara:strand:+ start:4922 stop:6163 length:1242 start_codon:yes stop_codon:yes gene_type:complete